ncbi:CBASS system CD-NTase/cGAS isopeptidase Cap3 [Gilvimarinus algae]|uniref:CBASS system CD-NTase/cGAS isopeptidase Cap3 n=1 Tax=Gilvimarinus algae TaxID=3058037 RepID=UPI00349FF9EE
MNEDWVYEDCDGKLVVILNHIVKRLLEHRQLKIDSVEAGGVLIGERRGSNLVVCDMSEPGPGDVQSRTSIDRRGSHHQEKVDQSFKASEGFHLYLGEWHTHPEDIPSPSLRDLTSWRLNLVRSKTMLVLIVGRQDLWIAKVSGNTIVELRPIARNHNK